MSNGNAKWTAGERVARDFVGPHPTLARRIDAAIARAVKARDAEWDARIRRFANYTRANLIGARNAEYVDQWEQCLRSLDRFRQAWVSGEPDPSRIAHTAEYLAAVGREVETRTITTPKAAHQTGKVRARTNIGNGAAPGKRGNRKGMRK